jgi:hypothetical protein
VTEENERLQKALVDARLFVALVEIHWPTWHGDLEQGREATDCLKKIDAALSPKSEKQDG